MRNSIGIGADLVFLGGITVPCIRALWEQAGRIGSLFRWKETRGELS